SISSGYVPQRRCECRRNRVSQKAEIQEKTADSTLLLPGATKPQRPSPFSRPADQIKKSAKSSLVFNQYQSNVAGGDDLGARPRAGRGASPDGLVRVAPLSSSPSQRRSGFPSAPSGRRRTRR